MQCSVVHNKALQGSAALFSEKCTIENSVLFIKVQFSIVAFYEHMFDIEGQVWKAVSSADI